MGTVLFAGDQDGRGRRDERIPSVESTGGGETQIVVDRGWCEGYNHSSHSDSANEGGHVTTSDRITPVSD